MTNAVILNLSHDSDDKSAFAPEYTYSAASPLTANTAVSFTIPTGAKIAIFSCDTPIWTQVDATAVIPVAKVDDGTASTFQPAARSVRGHSTISVIAALAGNVQISFYS